MIPLINREDAQRVESFDEGKTELPLDVYLKALAEAESDALISGSRYLHGVLESLVELLPKLVSEREQLRIQDEDARERQLR